MGLLLALKVTDERVIKYSDTEVEGSSIGM